MLACINKQGHVILVLKRTKTRTTYISTSRKYRKFQVTDNRLFTKEHVLLADDPVTIAEKWLKSPIKMTQEVKRRLEMIIAMKKNTVVAKCENLTEVPEGTDVISCVEDLQGRSLRSLTALYNKLSGQEPVKFENAEAASIAVWELFEDLEVEVKEKKERAEREKMTLIELPKYIGKKSVITNIKENPKREGSASYDRYAKYVEGMTVAEFCEAGGTTGDVRFDAERGHITLTLVEDEPKAKKTKEASAE